MGLTTGHCRCSHSHQAERPTGREANGASARNGGVGRCQGRTLHPALAGSTPVASNLLPLWRNVDARDLDSRGAPVAPCQVISGQGHLARWRSRDISVRFSCTTLRFAIARQFDIRGNFLRVSLHLALGSPRCRTVRIPVNQTARAMSRPLSQILRLTCGLASKTQFRPNLG